MDPRDRLIVALDTPSLAEAERLADRLADLVRWFKIGPHLFTAAGPASVAAIARHGRIFLDLKFHDIPSTAAAGVAGAARLGAALCTVHAAGGPAMLGAARDAAERTWAERGAAGAADAWPDSGRTRLAAVTLLTSVDAAVLDATGVTGSPRDVVVRLARLAQTAGVDGVVASPLEAGAVRAACGGGFLIVCPGIRPSGTEAGDQRRVLTPRAAIEAGADLLVVGRPITEAADPRAAAERILKEIAEG